jgi:hypothetical protein
MLMILGLVVPAAAQQQQRITIWGTPPREKPQMTKAAEGFPPLPLPVVPQRRSEKKRPPAPPILIANLANFSFGGWQGSPGAVDTLLQNAKKNLDVWYGWEQLDIDTIVRENSAGVDHRTPLVYLCAYYPMNLNDAQRKALKDYVLAGGTLLINCCGQQQAYDSTKSELARMFPSVELRRLPQDHPVYNANAKIEQVSYPPVSAGALDTGTAKNDKPRLDAVTLGSRAAVIVSLEDLACGWNEYNNPTVKRVSAQDSTRLGLNIITYVTAEMRLAKFLSRTQEVTGPSVRPRQQLAFAKLVHGGNWNPNPSAVPLFLKELAANTSIAVNFDRVTVQLSDPVIFNYPLLYMTGQWDPKLTKEEVAILHRYLTNGGVIIADSAGGRQEFDIAFRALCARLFPEAPLKQLPPDHPLFSSFTKIETVSAHHEAQPIRPTIEAVIVDGKPLVLYSRFGLGDGWARQFDAYAKCYAPADAVKLGTNLVVFAMQ